MGLVKENYITAITVLPEVEGEEEELEVNWDMIQGTVSRVKIIIYPLPAGTKTRTRVAGTGWSGVRVRVALGIPQGYPCHALIVVVSFTEAR